MRWAILSDVHANPTALKTALADAREQGVDSILCLGDVVGYGPDPEEAMALCREACDVTLMGNHDAAVAGIIGIGNFIPFAQDGVRRHAATLTEGDRRWLRSLPYLNSCRSFACVHGTPMHPSGFFYMNTMATVVGSLEWMAQQHKRLLFVGHTHHACCISYRPGEKAVVTGPDKDVLLAPRTRYIVNVGSVGYPRNDRDITYVLYDSVARKVSYRHLPFDFADYVRRLEGKNVRLPLWLSDYLNEHPVS